jgi:polysaccharide pyruvyl transferase WcaK-like protein
VLTQGHQLGTTLRLPALGAMGGALVADSDTLVRKRKRIGLLDHLGGGNLGDDATLDAVMQNIKSRWPDAEIFGFTMNPADTERRHGITAYPIRLKTWGLGPQVPPGKAAGKENVKSIVKRWRYLFRVLRAINAVAVRFPATLLQESVFLARSFGRLRSLDTLVISGSGQLLDWFGPWQFPYTIYKWVTLARLAKVKFIFLNVGAGPLTDFFSKLFVRRALRYADYVSFRDEESLALVRRIGFTRSASVFPDSVYALERPTFVAGDKRGSRGPVVGISPILFFSPRSVYPQKSQLLHDNLIAALSSFGSWLVRNDYTLTLLSNDIGVDPPAIEDLRMSLVSQEGAADAIDIPPIRTVEDLLCAMSSFDYLVTCRFHGVVFAHMLNIPVIALSHHPKMDTQMRELGMAEYCLDIRTIDGDALKRALTSLVQNRKSIKIRMAEIFALYRKRLSAQFDELVKTIL